MDGPRRNPLHPRGGGVVHRVGERSGKIEAITTLDTSRGEDAHYWPVALPGGRDFLFFIRSTRPENNGIYLAAVDGKTAPVRLVTSLSSGLYAPGRDGGSGHVLWVRDGELLAQPLDIDGRRLTGDVWTIASDVRVEESQRGTFASVSSNGTIVSASAKAADLEFAWFSRDGRKLDTLPIPRGKLIQPRISPDGKRLAFTRPARGTADIWMLDFASGATTQLTTETGFDENPAWSVDGNSLAYNGGLGQDPGIVIMTVDGSRPPRIAIGGQAPSDARFLPKRQALVASIVGERGRSLAIASLEGAHGLSELISEPGYVGQQVPSADGQWLAFVTDRTGRLEVVLSRWIEDGTNLRLNAQRLPVSPAGGTDPHWRADGREILYLAPDRTLMAVSVTISGNAVSLGKPARLFRLPADAGGWGSSWTANPDHTRFVAVNDPDGTAQTFRVLTNWNR
jgi:eukaryotic-like serine/threonine-protein kinase